MSNVIEFQPVERMLTIRQASEALQLSERTVAAMVASGTLHSVKIGKARRIAAEAINAVAKTGTSSGRK